MTTPFARQTDFRTNQLSPQQTFNQGIGGTGAAAPLRVRRLQEHFSNGVRRSSAVHRKETEHAPFDFAQLILRRPQLLYSAPPHTHPTPYPPPNYPSPPYTSHPNT